MTTGGRRPWYLRFFLWTMEKRIGMAPGPMVTMTFRPDLLIAPLRRYLARGASGKGAWTKGESELFAAFVSDLNTCHF